MVVEIEGNRATIEVVSGLAGMSRVKKQEVYACIADLISSGALPVTIKAATP